MAYFLDAELNALTLAEQAKPVLRRASAPGSPKKAATNRYAAKCSTCGDTVPANTGTLTNRNGKWLVAHATPCR